MNITFQRKAGMLLWTFAKLLATFEEHQYLFAAQCIWWIAAFVPLDFASRYLVENRKFPWELQADIEEPDPVIT